MLGNRFWKGLVDLIVPGVLLNVVGPYLASHRGVAYDPLSTVHVTHQFPVDGGIESHLAEIQFHFDVCSIQTERYGPVLSTNLVN